MHVERLYHDQKAGIIGNVAPEGKRIQLIRYGNGKLFDNLGQTWFMDFGRFPCGILDEAPTGEYSVIPTFLFIEANFV